MWFLRAQKAKVIKKFNKALFLSRIKQMSKKIPAISKISQYGTVKKIGDGILYIRGLPKARSGELLQVVKTGSLGIVLNVEKTYLKVVLLDKT